MKQYRPVFAIGYGDSISVGKKIGDFPTDGRGIFLSVVVPPIPVVGLLFGIDNDAATVGNPVGIVGRDPEIKSHCSRVGMSGYALALVVVTIDPNVGEVVTTEDPWKTFLHLLGHLIEKVASKPAAEPAAHEVVAGVVEENCRLKAEIPQSVQCLGHEKVIQCCNRHRRRKITVLDLFEVE